MIQFADENPEIEMINELFSDESMREHMQEINGQFPQIKPAFTTELMCPCITVPVPETEQLSFFGGME